MASFFDRVLAFGSRQGKDAKVCTELARYAVKRAYVADSLTEVQFLLDNAGKLWIPALMRYLSRAGISCEWKGGRPPIVDGLKAGKSFQAKAFAWIAENVVVDMDDIVRAERPEKKLQGLAVDRAQKGIEALIARLKKSDPDAAGIVNDRLSQAKEIEVEVVSTLTLVGPNGEVWDLDTDDYEVLRRTLTARQAILAKAA